MLFYLNFDQEQCDFYQHQMKNRKPKEQPFYVKRIKLRHSVMKTNQILQSISISDMQKKFHSACRDQSNKHETSIPFKLRRSMKDKETVEESDLYNCKANVVNYQRMHRLMKVCKTKKTLEKSQICGNIGLDIRRLVPDPTKAKKKTLPKEDETLTQIAKGQNKYRRVDYKTLQENNEGTYLNQDFEQFPMWNSQIRTINSSMKLTVNRKLNDKSGEKGWTPRSPSKKSKIYLYQRMTGSENKDQDQTNQIYEKRIKSYTEFLWKCMLAHGIYINLDLPSPQHSKKKIKAFVGLGNNCNMIKGLIKRRFWWALSETLTEDCLFVWSQLKVNKIFQLQGSAPVYEPQYKEQSEKQVKKRMIKTCEPSKRRSMRDNHQNKRSKEQNKNEHSNFNFKIWNIKDQEVLSSCVNIFSEENNFLSNKKLKEAHYEFRINQISQKFKKISIIEDLSAFQVTEDSQNHKFYKVKPIVHNHLENNFHLGNKKALFYNLRDYYHYQKRDVFQYVPLTFHIKNGFNDPQYKKFIQFYDQRQKKMKREESREVSNHKKMRNIWIVKPGENSNQGRGITVIDEIYELNSIIKQGQQPKNSVKNDQRQNSKTFIVQLYLDRPLLYNQRKFDIRHYMLITNLYGVTRAYWYEEGYIRTSSYLFNIHTFDPEIHLTNDAIQKKYSDYGRYEPANKISYSEFQSYLNTTFPERKYDFKRDVLPKMKTIARDSVKSVCKKLAPSGQMNNFQIFGLDFMIDRGFKPWLIEINTNPCLDCVCPLLDRIIPYMVEQSLKLSLDLVYPPPCHYPNTAKHNAPFVDLETFKYELIFDSSTEKIEYFRPSEQNQMTRIGDIGHDEEFNDDGKEMRLEELT